MNEFRDGISNAKKGPRREGPRRTHMDSEGPRRTQQNPVRPSNQRQTGQGAFAASSFFSLLIWMNLTFTELETYKYYNKYIFNLFKSIKVIPSANFC